MTTRWMNIAGGIEPLDGVELDATLVEKIERAGIGAQPRINFYTPTFKSYATSELAGCGKSAWPAVSITGGECALACDHCKAKILEPMIPARTPDALWQVVNEQIAAGAQGMLLTGGSNRNNEVEYDHYYPVVRRIKNTFPAFKIALHTALVDERIAGNMEDAGIDAAMETLNTAWNAASQDIYNAQQASGGDANGRFRAFEEWKSWRGARAQAGKVVPKGFPKGGTFSG